MTAIKCPYCKSEKVVKRGLSPTQNRGKQQRYLCRACNKTFIQDLGFWKMKTKPSIITMSIDMYLSNLSSRKMRNQLYRHLKTKRSHVTILNWTRKYVLKVQKFIDTLNPQLSGKVYADETEVDCENRKDIFWCSIDWDTRFINSTLYSPHSQNMKDAIEFMKRIKESKRPHYIQTDGLPFYPRAFKKVFWKLGGYDVEHRINNVSKTKKHNVRIEAVFMKIKDRVIDFRGFKALWSAPILMTGLIIQHNFIETHSGIRKVPCEVAGLKVDLGIDRWLGLIRFSSMNF